MVNAQRCMLMTEIIQEADTKKEGMLDERQNWPEEGQISFKNISLRYRPDTELVLKELTFEVAKGERIGVVGRTGAGKSTICLCISRILELSEGSIIIDGLDISQMDLKDLRSRITVIPQDPTMFNGTLRYNLDPLGRATDEEVINILKAAKLHDLIKDEGLALKISENGNNLSSGEKQLICICRAILRKSKVVILDEATSNIDIVTELAIQDLIDTSLKGSTVLTVAHRLNTIMASDKILVLDFGRLIEYDSPKNLMANKDGNFS